MIKAVVICEDHTLDEYILKPVLKQCFADAGQRVKFQFVPRTMVRGVNQALAKRRHREVFALYPMADVFFLIIDRDCDENREQGKFADRLSDAAQASKTMIGCLAIEELEVWALALHRKQLSQDWKVIRSDCHPKEAFFQPFVKLRKWHTGPGKGRLAAMKDLRGKFAGLKRSCPEVRQLSEQIQSWSAGPASKP